MRLCVARCAGGGQFVQIILPAGFVFVRQQVEIVPIVQAAVVPVRKINFQRIIAGHGDFFNPHAAFAGLQFFVADAVSAHFRTGRQNAQVFGRQRVFAAVVYQSQRIALGMHADFLGQGIAHFQAACTKENAILADLLHIDSG